MSELVELDHVGKVLRMRMNRPDKKNALTVDMYSRMADALGRARDDGEVRAVVILGTEGAFTSGNDVADFLQNPPEAEDSPVFRFLDAIATFPKPLLAGVTGVAVGIGTTMLLHCDLAYAASDARFRLPFVNLGLVPEAASTLLLPRMVGHVRAAELLFLGEVFSAEKACELGLVNAVIDAHGLEEHVMNQARRVAEQPPAAIRTAKRLMKRVNAEAISETMGTEGECFAAALKSPEAAEALQAFLQKREPDFSRFG